MSQIVIRDTEYYKILYDEVNKLAEYVWKAAILDLSEEDYKNILLDAYDLLFEFHPILLIQNMQDAIYPVTEAFQDWLAKNISKDRFEKSGVKKVAYVMPKDIISKIGLELLIERARSELPTIVRLYFDNLDEAKNWILKKKN